MLAVVAAVFKAPYFWTACARNMALHSKHRLPCLVYVEMGRSNSDTATLSFFQAATAAAGGKGNLWNVRISQIECDNPSR
jgi:hypothetical protein